MAATTATESKGNRIVLVSGATGSIGKEIALGAAKQAGVILLLPVRDLTKGAELATELKATSGNANIHILQLDLGSRASIINLANEVHTKYGRLDVLINNAAIATKTRELSVGSSDRSADGGAQIETQWAVNIQSYWLMMNRFRPLLAKASPAGTGRIVNVASTYAGDLDITDPQFVSRPYDLGKAYRQSTQSRRMITHEAASLFAGDHITVNCCHPGVVTSTLLATSGMATGFDSAAKGAATPLYLAFSPEVANVTGKFFENSKELADDFVKDNAEVKKVWAYCQSLAFVDDIPATGAAGAAVVAAKK